MLDEITYPIPNFTAASNFVPNFTGHDYLSMFGLNLNYVSKRRPWK